MLAKVPTLGVPGLLSFALLALQVAVPWTSRYFITQDGPSHLYTALVARDLLFNSHSPYAAVYALQSHVPTNWLTAILLNVLEILFGITHVEQALATVCIFTGYFGYAYLLRSLDPSRKPWTPVINFLLNTWFLWIGFYNFYLGMTVFPFVTGYYIRHVQEFRFKHAAITTTGMLILFFTHVFPAALTMLAIGLVACWVLLPRIVRGFSWRRLQAHVEPLLWTLIPLALPASLLLYFGWRFGQGGDWDSRLQWAIEVFPMHVFASATGRAGEQFFAMTGMLFFMVMTVLCLSRRNWKSERGALVVAGLICLFFYLIVPNSGFGGDELKIRFSWAMFLFGCLVGVSTLRSRRLHAAMSFYLAICLTTTLLYVIKRNVRGASRAAREYASVMQSIPPGSTLIRVLNPLDKTRERFGYKEVALEPMFHIDAWIAARQRLIDLSDYQALSLLFPVAYKSQITREQQYQLWDQEGSNGPESLKALQTSLPVPIDYVVVVGDPNTLRIEQAIASLGSNMHPVNPESSTSFARLYKRDTAR